MLFAYKNNKDNTLTKSLECGCKFSVPVIWAVTFLSVIAYIISNLFSGTNIENINNLTGKLIFPLINCGISFSLAGIKAIPSGLLSGLITQTGLTFSSHGTNAQGISGIYGCIAAGIIASYSLKWSERILNRYKDTNYPVELIKETIGMTITLLLTLFINEISMLINSLSILTLTGIGGVSSVLVSVILGIFMTADCMGPLYLSGYLFSSAALATGDGRLFVSMSAASVVPCLSIGIFCLLYSKRFTKSGRISAMASLTGGILGLPVAVLPFYTETPLKMITACTSGGCLASMLCTMFGCNTTRISKGILSVFSLDNPLYFLLSVLSGVLVTVFLMSLLFDTETTEETEKENTNAITVNTA